MYPTATATDHALAALAHPVRRAILDRLLQGELTVGEIARPYDMKMPTISRHLKVLESAELIQRTVEGRRHHCRINHQGITRVQEWLKHYQVFWNGQLDALEQYIDQNPSARPE
jgi:DNA-binding transcriptional ArsR family regulator